MKKNKAMKKSSGYSSIAGAPSEKSGQPYGSFCAYWPEGNSKPGAGYPDGAADIDGVFKQMHGMMKKQWSDKLY